MSFWSEASGTTKGIVIVGGILLLLGLVYLLYPEPERVQDRGVESGQGVTGETGAE